MDTIIPTIISIVALILSVLGLLFTIKYSNISVVHSLQQLVLEKAKDCNILYERAANDHGAIEIQFLMIPTVSEIIITLQLLDNSLNRYFQKKRREFYLLQFWIQLNTGLRTYLKNAPIEGHLEITGQQLLDIRKTFSAFFEKY